MELFLDPKSHRFHRSQPFRHNFAKKLRNQNKPYQLKLFSPYNGFYEYSAVVTDTKQWDPEQLLQFVSGRSAQENSISELKSSFAFDQIPTNQYQANSAYMQMSQMAYNLSISMQHEKGLARKNPSNPKTTRVYQTKKWEQGKKSSCSDLQSFALLAIEKASKKRPI